MTPTPPAEVVVVKETVIVREIVTATPPTAAPTTPEGAPAPTTTVTAKAPWPTYPPTREIQILVNGFGAEISDLLLFVTTDQYTECSALVRENNLYVINSDPKLVELRRNGQDWGWSCVIWPDTVRVVFTRDKDGRVWPRAYNRSDGSPKPPPTATPPHGNPPPNYQRASLASSN